MNLNLLIDSNVRQTIVLIAQLATTAGARAPLAHIATVLWVIIHQQGSASKEMLEKTNAMPQQLLDAALEQLVKSGRVNQSDENV